MRQNPFSLSFGKEPASYIDRDYQSNEVLESFTADNPAYQVCMITGVRGSGKTVLLSTISNNFRKDAQWVVVDLNPERDLLTMLAAELSNRKDLLELFRDARINLSFLGFGIEIDGEPPITDIVVALRRMLGKLTQSGKRVLITIDEASSTKSMREFASQFQIFMREGLSVFLLMTGLYENIYELQNEKTLTFLYRAPKIALKPLSIPLIAQKYLEIFDLTQEESISMAKATEGYSFAYQVLGYLCWTKEKPWNQLLPEYDTYLEEYVYDKIWSELSAKDKAVLHAMSSMKVSKTLEISAVLHASSNNFTVYRNRLLRKGLIYSPEYGSLAFSLPRLREFVQRVYIDY